MVRVWDFSGLTGEETRPATTYASAKVLVTGNSGVGKSGLAHWMVHQKLVPTISTDAVWATILPFPQTRLSDSIRQRRACGVAV
jgi:GTPase SAR1 family protein